MTKSDKLKRMILEELDRSDINSYMKQDPVYKEVLIKMNITFQMRRLHLERESSMVKDRSLILFLYHSSLDPPADMRAYFLNISMQKLTPEQMTRDMFFKVARRKLYETLLLTDASIDFAEVFLGYRPEGRLSSPIFKDHFKRNLRGVIIGMDEDILVDNLKLIAATFDSLSVVDMLIHDNFKSKTPMIEAVKWFILIECNELVLFILLVIVMILLTVYIIMMARSIMKSWRSL